ncbi:MAG: DUF3396 domain-containing protein [Rhodocyclaceae bacterium]|nr:DUF3396 domain-containing protein [Rhodocyclaceae bacterium]
MPKIELSKIEPESGRTFLREVFIAAFFLPAPIDETVSAIDQAFELFLAMVPNDCFRWASVSATSEEWKPFGKTTLARCKAQLRREAAANRKLTYFELADGEIGGSVPRYGITVLGGKLRSNFPGERTLVQLSFPIDAAMMERADAFVARLAEIAAVLPVDSGYGSPAIQWSEFNRDQAIGYTRKIIAKHPGYDVNQNTIGRKRLGSKIRGARWLTFLGSEILERLGGREALRKKLPTTFEFISTRSCLVIRAGNLPELGDTVAKLDTPHLRELAAVLEPATAFDEVALLGSLADWDKNALRKWERRFLDPA